jgi:hypothetical protein
VFDAAVAQILDHGERMARARLAELPRGTWSAEDFVDDDGVEDRLVKMKATVTVAEDEMVVDWTGSDPAAKGPINMPFGLTVGISSLVFKAVTTPDLTATEGNFRPLRVIAPPGSLMHAVPPAPTFTLWTGLLAGEVILKALAQGMPDLVPACSGGDVCSMMGLGVSPRTGRSWLEAPNEGVGFGGHAGGDGENGGHRQLPTDQASRRAVTRRGPDPAAPIVIVPCPTGYKPCGRHLAADPEHVGFAPPDEVLGDGNGFGACNRLDRGSSRDVSEQRELDRAAACARRDHFDRTAAVPRTPDESLLLQIREMFMHGGER